MGDVRLQAGLGGIKELERQDDKMGHTLSVGVVTKVHHKNHTADVTLLESKNQLLGSILNEGLTGCRIMEKHAGWDSEFESYYGDLTPIQEGEYVVIAFLDDKKERPIILGTFHDHDNKKNPMPSEYPLPNLEQEQKFARLSVSRTQDYNLTKGTGEKEIVHHSKAFMVGLEQSIDDSINGYKFDNLSMINKLTGKVVSIPESKRTFAPLDFLFSICDKFSSAANYLKLWVSAKTCEFRLSKQSQNNTLTSISVDSAGNFQVVRQTDSNVFGQGSSKAILTIGSNGSISLTKNPEGATININPNGAITISNSSSISISGGNVNVSSNSTININGSGNVDVRSSSKVEIRAPRVVIR